MVFYTWGMTQNLTQPIDQDIGEFLSTVSPERRRADAAVLDQLFQRVTGWQPVLWRGGMLGYGHYDYQYDSGHSGRSLATGFAPRKANMVVYIMPGYQDFSQILADLGPHRLGKSCLYLGALSKINLSVLEELIRAGLDDLATRWPVSGS